MWKFIHLRLYAVAIGDIFDILKPNFFNMLQRFNQLSYDYSLAPRIEAGFIC